MQPGPGNSLPPPCATRDGAIAKQHHCRFCDLSGQVTIYHREYVGLPTRQYTDHNGTTRTGLAIAVAHCWCEVGRWMRQNNKPEVCNVIPELPEIGRGRYRNWSPVDPRLADSDDSEVPDWGALRKWLDSRGAEKSKMRQVVTKVQPAPDPRRAQAYREMGEPLPGSIPIEEFVF